MGDSSIGWRASDNPLAQMLQEVETFTDATPAQWDIARARLRDLAPDLYECVTGEGL